MGHCGASASASGAGECGSPKSNRKTLCYAVAVRSDVAAICTFLSHIRPIHPIASWDFKNPFSELDFKAPAPPTKSDCD